VHRSIAIVLTVIVVSLMGAAGCGQKESQQSSEQSPGQQGKWVQLISLPMSAVDVDYNVCMDGWRSGEFEVQTGVLRVTADVSAVGESDSRAYGTQDGKAEPWVGMDLLKVGEPVNPNALPDVHFAISPADTKYEVPVSEQLSPGTYTLHSWGVDANSTISVWELR